MLPLFFQAARTRKTTAIAYAKGLLSFALSSISILGIMSCGTMSNGRGWGQDATLFPGWKKVGTAALDAALAPGTWAPVAGALILQIDNWDHRVSTWASDKTPIFGSQNNAMNYSDYFLHASEAVYGLTVLTTPSGDHPGDWIVAKFKGLAVGMAAYGINYGITEGLQNTTHRGRPNNWDYLSFPSSHSSSTSVYSTLAACNLDSMCLPREARLAGQVGCAMLSLGTAWARVEGKMHYPSDVLAGMALGHFLGVFMSKAFLNIDDGSFMISFEPSRNNVLLYLRGTF
jgi:membrane-associated phospholipid phosphatase